MEVKSGDTDANIDVTVRLLRESKEELPLQGSRTTEGLVARPGETLESASHPASEDGAGATEDSAGISPPTPHVCHE
eukprot:1392816-Amorphochlora_amoeboformis.AAC.1